MLHKSFIVVSAISIIISLICSVLYCYYITMYPKLVLFRFGLKPIPVTTNIIIIISYFIIYKIHYYSALMGLSMLFCLLGDIALMFYIPTLSEYSDDIWLLFGGISFFIARCIMCTVFIMSPYKNYRISLISTSLKKCMLVGIPIFIYMTWVIIYFIMYMKPNIIRLLLPLYYVVMFLQLFLSILRIRGFEYETLSSQILGTIGTCLFTISDSLLFWDMFISPIYHNDVISMCIYWIAMYLLSISVVRNISPTIERTLVMV